MTIIKFTDTMGVPEEYRPKPADKFVPDWYKNLESYMGDGKKPDGNGGTSCRCGKSTAISCAGNTRI